MASKSNSKAGVTAEQLASNSTSLLVMQQKRCPSFDIFDAVFGSCPNVKPVHPTEVGGGFDSDADEAFGDSQQEMNEVAAAVPALAPAPTAAAAAPDAAPAAAAAPAVLAAAAAPAVRAANAAAGGKAEAPFHLAPSKKEKKMDLGEAYLKAQQTRIESLAVSAQAKTRCDLVIALTLQGKSAAEIADFLKVTGF